MSVVLNSRARSAPARHLATLVPTADVAIPESPSDSDILAIRQACVQVGLISPGVFIFAAMQGMKHLSPCTTPAGELLLPRGYSLRVEGSKQDTYVLGYSGMECSQAVAFVDATRTLLIGEFHTEGERIVAVDADSRVVRWRGPPGLRGGRCLGIAVLPNAGVCAATLDVPVLATLVLSRLIVVRLADGALLASIDVNEQFSGFLAANSIGDIIFVSLQNAVQAFHWDGTTLRRSQGRVSAVFPFT